LDVKIKGRHVVRVAAALEAEAAGQHGGLLKAVHVGQPVLGHATPRL
jgi:hypothetical protein